MSRKVLNFAPVKFAEDSKAYKLFVLPYKDENYLKSLRDQYNDTNSFFRDGEFLYHSPMVAEGGYREGELREFQVDRDVNLTKSLVHHILFRSIFQLNVKASSFYPIKFLSRKPGDNAIKQHLTESEAEKIAYRLGFVIDTRILIRNGIPNYGVLFNAFYSWDIEINFGVLAGMGLDLGDAYVVRKEQFHEAFQPKRSLLGKVVAIHGGMATVDNEELEMVYPLEELYLENSFKNREKLLSKVLQPFKAKQIERQLFMDGALRMGAPAISKNIDHLFKYFSKQNFSNGNGFGFTIDNFIDSSNPLWSETRIDSPTYHFDRIGNETDIYRDRGLTRFGPYHRNIFSPTTPLVLVFCRATSEGRVTQFLGKLRNGLPNVSSNGIKPFEAGFVSKYKLAGISFKIYCVTQTTIADYERIIARAMEDHADADPALAIVETADEFRALPPDQNPYLYCKAALLILGIPSQEFRLESMQLPDKQLAYVLNNACLAMYAKMGGVPWKIPGAENVHHEIVFGIGHEIFKSGRFGGGSRIVGFTTVFSGDGEYLLGKKSKTVPYEDYFGELLHTLGSEINTIREDRNWKKGQTVRIIFHLFKPFKNKEIDVIQNLVQSLQGEYDLRFAFLTFSNFHPYFLYNEGQAGIQDWKNGGQLKGVWQPERNSNLKIDDRQYLLQLTGPKEIKTHTHGYAAPILMKLHESSTFMDMEYLVRQASRFSSNSWRSFFPSPMPVTITYSDQIAKMVGQMMRSVHFNRLNLINPKLDHKVWFL